MKLYLLFFLCSVSVLAQKKYAFDYKITYDYKLKDTSELKEIVYYTNSKDNSYVLKIADKDSVYCEFTFLDNNGIYFKTLFDKKQLETTEDFLVDCEIVKSYSNPYKYQTDNYDYEKGQYLSEGKTLTYYFLKSNRPSREKRKKLSTFYYYVENDTDFHLPILTCATPYEEWKLERNIPNGIAKEMFYLDYKK